MKQRDTENKLLTVKKASTLYGPEPSLIYHWIRYRKFDFYKFGKKVLLPQSEFEQFLELHRRKKYDNGDDL